MFNSVKAGTTNNNCEAQHPINYILHISCRLQ